MGMMDGIKMDREKLPKEFRRGDIFYVNNDKRGQVGSEMKKDRPAVIVSSDTNNGHSEVVEVVFLTSQPKKELPTHVKIRSTGRESVAICEQPTPVSVARIKNYIGKATEEEMKEIGEALLIFFELKQQEETKKYIRHITSLEIDVDNLHEDVQRWQRRTTKAETECGTYKRMCGEILAILAERKGK